MAFRAGDPTDIEQQICDTTNLDHEVTLVLKLLKDHAP